MTTSDLDLDIGSKTTGSESPEGCNDPRLVEATYTLDGMVIAVLGAGKIGEALIAGLLRGGHKPEELLFTARRADRALQLHGRMGRGPGSRLPRRVGLGALRLIVVTRGHEGRPRT